MLLIVHQIHGKTCLLWIVARKDGVEVNMAVMSQKGLIGRVIEVNAASSKIELLTSENQNSNHFPVRISGKDGETFGILSSYDQKREVLGY